MLKSQHLCQKIAWLPFQKWGSVDCSRMVYRSDCSRTVYCTGQGILYFSFDRSWETFIDISLGLGGVAICTSEAAMADTATYNPRSRLGADSQGKAAHVAAYYSFLWGGSLIGGLVGSLANYVNNL